ncbi:MAG: hypothetical protein ABI241_00400 [Bacteroidia bacterium]
MKIQGSTIFGLIVSALVGGLILASGQLKDISLTWKIIVMGIPVAAFILLIVSIFLKPKK